MTWNMVWNMIWEMMWYDIIWYEIWDYMLWNDVIWNDMMLYTLLGKRLSYPLSGVGSKTVVTFNLWAGPSIFSSATTGDVWITPYLPIWGNMLNVGHVSMRHHGLRPTAVTHPFSPLHISLCLAGVKYYQRITILRIVFQKLALPGCFLCTIFALFFPYFLLVGLLM